MTAEFGKGKAKVLIIKENTPKLTSCVICPKPPPPTDRKTIEDKKWHRPKPQTR